MAESAETVEFWKGIVIGTHVDLAAAAYARGDFRRLFSFAPGPLPAEPLPVDPKPAFRNHAQDLKLRLEASENAGDPTRLSPVTMAGDLTPQGISIERTGGAPGPA